MKTALATCTSLSERSLARAPGGKSSDEMGLPTKGPEFFRIVSKAAKASDGADARKQKDKNKVAASPSPRGAQCRGHGPDPGTAWSTAHESNRVGYGQHFGANAHE